MNFVAHLYQALVQGYPLLIAARIEEFKAGSELYQFLAFARCALPAVVKQTCNIRLFTRELVYNQDSAQLVLIPDDYVYQALQRLPTALLLDSQGKQQDGRRGQRQIEARFADYASYIVQLFGNLPSGLLPYSQFLRRDQIKKITKEATDSEWAYPCYVVAYCLASGFTQESADELFSHMRDPDYPWFELLPAFTEQEWEQFPTRTLLDFVLGNPNNLPAELGFIRSKIITSLGVRGLLPDNEVSLLEA